MRSRMIRHGFNWSAIVRIAELSVRRQASRICSTSSRLRCNCCTSRGVALAERYPADETLQVADLPELTGQYPGKLRVVQKVVDRFLTFLDGGYVFQR